MKRRTVVVIALVLILALLSGCGAKLAYDSEWIIGKNSAEIIERYGEFYKCDALPDSDGLYRNCKGSFVIMEERPGLLNNVPATIFSISFDENGVAQATDVSMDPWFQAKEE